MAWEETLAAQNFAYDAMRFNGLNSPYRTLNSFAPTGSVIQAGLPMDPDMAAARTGLGRIATGSAGRAFAPTDVVLQLAVPEAPPQSTTADHAFQTWAQAISEPRRPPVWVLVPGILDRSYAIPVEWLEKMTVEGLPVQTAISVDRIPPGWFIGTEGPAAISSPDGRIQLVPIERTGWIGWPEPAYPSYPSLPFWP